MMRNKSTKGFTLIELMIVVAIIGILAAIAIPNFLRFQLKSKSSEGKVNLAAIRTAEESYLAEYGTYVAAAASPTTGIPGPTKALFNDAGGFTQIGWSPEGDVFFVYQVTPVATLTGYTAHAAADIDGDTTNQEWGYVHPDPAGTAVAVGACPLTGVWNGTANAGLDTVGPCANGHGQSIF